MIPFSKPVAFGLLAAACILAAGGGGYIATRYNALPGTPANAAAPAAARADARPAPVAPEAAAPAPVQAAPPTAAPAPVAEARPIEPPRLAAPNRTPPRLESAKPATTARREPRAAAPTVKTDPVEPPAAIEPSLPQVSAPAQAPAAPPVASDSAGVQPVEHPVPVPQEKVFDQLVVPAESVLGLQLESTVSTSRARVEDRVEARVTRNVPAGDRVAIPAGTRVEGTVTLVERGGKVRERGRLGIRFNTLLLPDGSRTAINTETVYREGEPVAGKSAAKITGATAGGAFLGALLGGGKGAAIGGAVGAAGGTAAVMAGSEQVVTLPAGTLLTVRLLGPVTVEVER